MGHTSAPYQQSRAGPHLTSPLLCSASRGASGSVLSMCALQRLGRQQRNGRPPGLQQEHQQARLLTLNNSSASQGRQQAQQQRRETHLRSTYAMRSAALNTRRTSGGRGGAGTLRRTSSVITSCATNPPANGERN